MKEVFACKKSVVIAFASDDTSLFYRVRIRDDSAIRFKLRLTGDAAKYLRVLPFLHFGCVRICFR